MTHRRLLPASVIAFFFLLPFNRLPAAEPVKASEPVKTTLSTWDVVRTSVPESIAELKALETAVKKVVEKATPCTVGILIRSGDGMAAGSGVIVSEDGLVLTAGHVSGEPGKECSLILPDGTRIKGKTLGNNEKFDSGMIQITTKGPNNGKWPFTPLGRSGKLKKGQWLVALGHPGGFQRNRPPVARLGQVQGTSDSYVRTNCTIVGGDSGGPLFDLAGHLVGIHSRIDWTLTSNIHVPSDAYKNDWESLTKGEQVGKVIPARAMIGVVFEDKTKKPVVTEVNPDGPADKAGLRSGDIILEFDGREVTTQDEVRALLRKMHPGDEVDIVLQRGTKTVTKSIKLGKRDS